MPVEERQKSSGGLVFKPTPEEVKQLEEQKQLRQDIDEIKRLKSELQSLVEEAKKNE